MTTTTEITQRQAIIRKDNYGEIDVIDIVKDGIFYFSDIEDEKYGIASNEKIIPIDEKQYNYIFKSFEQNLQVGVELNKNENIFYVIA